MSEDVRVRVDGGLLTVSSPYNPEYVAAARRLGGRWDPRATVWRFDAREEQRVRDLLRQVYGTDGTSAVETVTVRVCAGDYAGERQIYVAGRVVVRRRCRDEEPRLASAVTVVGGSFAPCGGSAKYPRLGDNDAVLQVRDVPRVIAERDGLDIVPDPGPAGLDECDRQSLAAERQRLARRLARIDALLASTQDEKTAGKVPVCTTPTCAKPFTDAWPASTGTPRTAPGSSTSSASADKSASTSPSSTEP